MLVYNEYGGVQTPKYEPTNILCNVFFKNVITSTFVLNIRCKSGRLCFILNKATSYIVSWLYISVTIKLLSPSCRIYASVKRVSICSNNGLSPIRPQAIIWTNAGLLPIGPLRTNLIKIQNFSFTKMHLKTSSEKWWPFCPGGDLLMHPCGTNHDLPLVTS